MNRSAKSKMDYGGFESTILDLQHSFLVIGKESDLEDLIKDIV